MSTRTMSIFQLHAHFKVKKSLSILSFAVSNCHIQVKVIWMHEHTSKKWESKFQQDCTIIGIRNTVLLVRELTKSLLVAVWLKHKALETSIHSLAVQSAIESNWTNVLRLVIEIFMPFCCQTRWLAAAVSSHPWGWQKVFFFSFRNGIRFTFVDRFWQPNLLFAATSLTEII